MSEEVKSSEEHLPYMLPYQQKNWSNYKTFLQWMNEEPCTSEKELFDRMQHFQADMYVSNLIQVNKIANKQDLWKDKLLSELIPYIAGLALEIKPLFEGQTIRILRRGVPEENILTRRQISSILANMFFCTLSSQGTEEEAKFLPANYDFLNIITQITDKKRNAANIQKLRCLLNYFWIIRGFEKQWVESKSKSVSDSEAKEKEPEEKDKEPEEKKIDEKETNPESKQLPSSSKDDKLYSFWEQEVVYERLVLDSNDELFKYLADSKDNLSEVIVDNTRGIEEFSEFDCVHVDFANKFIGGGVLRTGCVQEEIMFSVAPELFASIPFTHRLYQNEAILISGTHRFCDFKGYGESFAFNGVNPLKEVYPALNKQQKTYNLAMDALPFKFNPQSQYSEENLTREITKAYTGFRLSSRVPVSVPIISGNWGCGVYKGDPQLKFVIQLLAASALSRKLYYVPFSNPALNEINKVLLKLKKTSISKLYQQMNEFSQQTLKTNKKQSLFEFLINSNNKTI